MFVGHYAASLALKKVEKKASLGMLFLAVQIVDIFFFPFMLIELEYMPYTHSLLASLLCAGFVYLIFRFVFVKNKRVALVMGIAVLSHWFFDLLVHTPDLPLWSDTSMKLGLGLWRHAIATYALETVFLLSGLWIYLRATKATSSIGKYGMPIFVVVLLLINVVNIFGPPLGHSKASLALSALVMYFAFAGIAHWLDKKRV
jgi:hypothetical protein